MESGRPSDSTRAFVALCQAGWSVEAMSVVGASGEWRWVVTGCNGEHVIRAERPTKGEAWKEAAEQARAMGLLGEDG